MLGFHCDILRLNVKYVVQCVTVILNQRMFLSTGWAMWNLSILDPLVAGMLVHLWLVLLIHYGTLQSPHVCSNGIMEDQIDWKAFACLFAHNGPRSVQNLLLLCRKHGWCDWMCRPIFQSAHRTICVQKSWCGYRSLQMARVTSVKSPTGGRSVSVRMRCCMDALRSLMKALRLWSSPTQTSWITRYRTADGILLDIYSLDYCGMWPTFILHGIDQPVGMLLTQLKSTASWAERGQSWMMMNVEPA